MSDIASILVELIKVYHKTALSNNRGSRLVLPGITTNIAKKIHKDLLDEDEFTSYLVVSEEEVNEDEKSNIDEKCISPMGLTSLRTDSFIAIVCPDQMSKIPDSIKGSGGATRSDQYTEEWPWIDDKSESFKFNGVVLDKLISRWTADEKEQDWLRIFVMECLVKHTAKLPIEERKSILLEDILGDFSRDKYPEIKDIKEKMLFHVGVPLPASNLEDFDNFISVTKNDCERIVKKHGKGGARDSAMEMIEEVFEDPSEHDQVRKTLNYFLDKLGPTKFKNIGPLAFYDCWDRENPLEWRRLSGTNLQRLFETEQPSLAVITGITLECDRSVKSRNPDIIATFADEVIDISVSFQIPPDEYESDWTIRVNRIRNTILEKAIEKPASGRQDFSLSMDKVGSYNKNFTLSINLHSSSDEQRRAHTTFSLHVCGEERPAFSLVEEPSFKVVDGNDHDPNQEESELIETDIPIKMHLFTHSENDPALHDQDNKKYALTKFRNGIFHSERIDPTSEKFSEHLKMVSSFGKLETVIGIKAIFTENGEFTLEDELRVNISCKKKDKINNIYPIFKGISKESYPRLGNIDEKSLRRSAFALQMSEKEGWRPIIGDLGKIKGKFSCKEYVVFFGEVEIPEFNSIVLNEEATNLLEEYQLVRYEVLKLVEKSFDGNENNHPVYATHPVFVEERAEEIEESIVKYLKAYKNIITYAKDNKSTLERLELLVMLYLDCLVYCNAEEKDLSYAINLIGPWHPLVLAKRFMVQSELLDRTDRINDKENIFWNLTVLLKGIKGFSWITGVHKDKNELVPLYVFATSDPGWQLSIRREIGLKIFDVVKIVDKTLGLEININDFSTGHLAETAIKSFLRTFPSKRSIGINFSEGYRKNQTISSMRRIMTEENGISELGEKIPGGIRIAFDEVVEGDEVVIDQISPPLMVYDPKDRSENIEKIRPDIRILAPREKIEFQQVSENEKLPRGLGKKSVFSEPILKLASGGEEGLKSISLEFDNIAEDDPDDPDELGSAYFNAIAEAFEAADVNIGLFSYKALPDNLSGFQWIVSPGGGMDPAIFVEWVRQGAASEEDRALWDYNVDIGESKNTNYILSRIVKEFKVSVNGFFKEDVASGFISDLGKLGLAIGGEALKTGRNALGAIGIVNTIRLHSGSREKNIMGVFRKDKYSAGFLIPVDSFTSFFGLTNRRTDLIAIQLILKGEDEPHLDIYAWGIESKFFSAKCDEKLAQEALQQAKESINKFKELIEISLKNGGMPERLGLLNILKFGLRISSPSQQREIVEWIKIEQRVYKSVLRGNYEYKTNKFDAVVVSTEGEFSGAAESNELNDGMWFRLNKENSPVISEEKSTKIKEMRAELSKNFNIQENFIEQTDSREGIVPSESTISTDSSTPPVPVKDVEIPIIVEDIQDSTDSSTPPVPVKDRKLSEELIPPNQQEVAPRDAKLEKIWIGTDDGRRSIFLDPESLENSNMMITGKPGSGKTQLLKYLICKIREQQKNTLIIEIQRDFSQKPDFENRASLDVAYVTDEGLPFNPLIPIPRRHSRTEELFINLPNHINEIVSLFRRIFDLGPIQETNLQETVLNAFENIGINVEDGSLFQEEQEFPYFGQIEEMLREMDPLAYNRLRSFFTLNIFRQEFSGRPFSDLLNKSIVISLVGISNPIVQNAIMELIILSAYNYYNIQDNAEVIKQFFVIDEANRIVKSQITEEFVRQCRKFGVSTILSSQYLDEFKDTVTNSMDTKIFHTTGGGITKAKQVTDLIGIPGQEQEILNLNKFELFMDNPQNRRSKTRIINYPMYLIHSHLKVKKEATFEEVSNIEGIQSTRVKPLLEQLEKLGLVVIEEGERIRLLERNDL